MKIKQTLSLILIVCFSFAFDNNNNDEIARIYVQTYKDLAIKEMKRSGIPASITLGQGLLESGYGQSSLARKANNHFGIKCKVEWTGSTYYHKDDDYDKNGKLKKSCFRSYDSAEQSYIDHTEFLVHRDRYRELFDYAHTDYVSWAKGLKKCGYATNPRYADMLISTIERFGLYQYDQLQPRIYFYDKQGKIQYID